MGILQALKLDPVQGGSTDRNFEILRGSKTSLVGHMSFSMMIKSTAFFNHIIS